MSKIIITFLVVILQFAFFVSNVSALDSCTALGIEYEPKFVPENSGGINFVFTIKNSNTQSNLFNKEVRLYFDKKLGPWDDWASRPTTVTNNSFSINVFEDQALLKKGVNIGRLEWKPDPSKTFEGYCSNIRYQVSTGTGGCVFSLPKEIPPGTSYPIKFLGSTDTNYELTFGASGAITNATTDTQGQGDFGSIPMPGLNGETITVRITSIGLARHYCSQDVKISATTPPPPSPSAGPVLPPGQSTMCDPKTNPNCTRGGGISCDPPNPAIQTAIGCIHTNPADLIADVLKFGVGIGGGLAFLMMLLGAFQMLTSAGNPETLQAGRDRLTSAVIGLLIIIFSVLLLQIIGVDILGIPGFGRS